MKWIFLTWKRCELILTLTFVLSRKDEVRMKERWRIGISLAVVFVAGVFVSSYVKGEDPGKEALHIAL